MTEETYIWTREQKAKAIENAASRLHNLCRSGGPEIVIEATRQLLARRLIFFPVDRELQESLEGAANRDRDLVDEHLMKTGFYPPDPPEPR